MKVTPALLRELQTPKGGYTRETLAALGVPWPPPKGWKKRLLKGNKYKVKKKAKKPQHHKPKSPTRSFYKSVEWRRKRYEILKRYGARCMCCGVSARDGAIINVDHIKPVWSHWHLRLDDDNLQVLCGACNQGKGGLDQTDWREEPEEPSLAVLMGERVNLD